MRKPWIPILLMFLPLPAFAGECDRWTAGLQEDEGGSVMTAHICAPAGNSTHELFVQCGEPGRLSIRFVPVAPKGYPPEDAGFKTDLEFSFDQEVFTRPAVYEEMDGAMVVETAIDAPFMFVMQVQRQMTVADVGDRIPSATFTLDGSRPALGKLIASCAKQ